MRYWQYYNRPAGLNKIYSPVCIRSRRGGFQPARLVDNTLNTAFERARAHIKHVHASIYTIRLSCYDNYGGVDAGAGFKGV
jgi:hypothetical protein